MRVSDELEQALRSFAQAERGIIEFGIKGDPRQAPELIRMRKQVVAQFAILGAALEADPFLAEKSELKRELLRLFFSFRSANSTSLADWPAVRVKDDVPGFKQAARSVGKLSQTFWSKIRTELGIRL